MNTSTFNVQPITSSQLQMLINYHNKLFNYDGTQVETPLYIWSTTVYLS